MGSIFLLINVFFRFDEGPEAVRGPKQERGNENNYLSQDEDDVTVYTEVCLCGVRFFSPSTFSPPEHVLVITANSWFCSIDCNLQLRFNFSRTMGKIRTMPHVTLTVSYQDKFFFRFGKK